MMLPKKYPEHWKKNVLHMPLPLWYLLCGFGVIASLYNVYGACAEQDLTTNLISLGLTIFILACCLIMKKTNRVNMDYINAQRERIISDALSVTEER